MSYKETINVAMYNKSCRQYPDIDDSRSRDGMIFPKCTPEFKLKFDSDITIFTIGSCFARNIEEALADKGVNLPTHRFSVPQEEFPGRSNGLLNEYNPGTMSQRILYGLAGKSFPTETIVERDGKCIDLLLAGGSDVTYERAVERRAEIDAVYAHLPRADVVIITLGLIEAWFDEETKLFLNRPPPHWFGVKHSDRFTFKKLDVFEAFPLLHGALDALLRRGIKVILTVSPVPIHTTLSPKDCVVANEFSKSVLRVCAERLSARAGVEYFPSYETVRTAGLKVYARDQIHVHDGVVRKIVAHMLDSFST